MPDSELLNRLKTILAQTSSRRTKAACILDAIREDGHYRWVGMYDVDIARGMVTNIAWCGPGAPAYRTLPITKGLTGRAIAERKPVNVGDTANDPGYLATLATTRSEIIVPVFDVTGERVIGTIDVESERMNAFDPAAQALLEDCARLLTPFWIATDPDTVSG